MDRLASWAIFGPNRCILCCREEESDFRASEKRGSGGTPLTRGYLHAVEAGGFCDEHGELLHMRQGDIQSLMEVRKVLQEFSVKTGLQINPEKSELFLSGMNVVEKENMSSSVGIALSSLPREIQLVISVIYGMINAWSMTFVLLKFILKEIDSLCSRFIWQHAWDHSPSYRVSWTVICKPKKEGGVGIRMIEETHVVFRLKFVLLLLTKAGPLWVAWIRHNVFKGKTYWEVKETTTITWNLKKLLRLKVMVRPFTKINLGDGKKTSFWYDSWLPLGPLIDFIGSAGPRLLRISKMATVADAIRDGSWSLPGAQNDRIQQLHILLLQTDPARHDVGPDT
ncbi:PREDICTED: uncharacterized protein LOC104801631, partial [Tarenaya hassleriana]|uniref:uncharacterized protein LOC104801631 n=1 Tax=Tarenaya hassleriana TaxID=28532 RepID=UPI00053C9E41